MAKDDKPHVTMRRMADYLTASGAHQRLTIIQSMKSRLGKKHFAPYYLAARSAIREYHSGNRDVLDEEIQRLLRERRDAVRPADIAKIENNLRVISDYHGRFSDQQLEHRSARFSPLMVNGVRITVEPTLSGKLLAPRKDLVVNVLVDTQAGDPTDNEIEYVLEMLHRGSGITNPAPVKGAQYWHPASGNSWYLTAASKRRWRDIEDAAHEIALRWPTIES